MKKMYPPRTNRGFTIVELLIVIVVIAILAAITIVAYSGVQARSRVAAKESTVDALKKKMEAYRVINDAYPISSDGELDAADLDSLDANIIKSLKHFYCSDSEGIDIAEKTKVCVASDIDHYLLIWWNDQTNTWWYSRQGTVPYVDKDAGSGDYPELPG